MQPLRNKNNRVCVRNHKNREKNTHRKLQKNCRKSIKSMKIHKKVLLGRRGVTDALFQTFPASRIILEYLEEKSEFIGVY